MNAESNSCCETLAAASGSQCWLQTAGKTRDCAGNGEPVLWWSFLSGSRAASVSKLGNSSAFTGTMCTVNFNARRGHARLDRSMLIPRYICGSIGCPPDIFADIRRINLVLQFRERAKTIRRPNNMFLALASLYLQPTNIHVKFVNALKIFGARCKI